MDSANLSPFLYDSVGNVIGLVSTGILMPHQENPYRMEFGGEVLKSFDELSGLLAGRLFGGDALHLSELVLFRRPIFTGYSYQTVFRVVSVRDGIALIYGEVRSTPLHTVTADSAADLQVRYAGLAVCAHVDHTNGKIVRDASPIVILPTEWVSDSVRQIGAEYFELQRRMAKLLK